MNATIQGILIGAGATVLAAAIIWAATSLHRRASLPNNVGQLRRGEFAIFGALEKMTLALRAYGAVNDTMLEVIKEGKINGNIIKAIDKNTIGGKHLDSTDEIIHEFLHTEAVGGEVVGK